MYCRHCCGWVTLDKPLHYRSIGSISIRMHIYNLSLHYPLFFLNLPIKLIHQPFLFSYTIFIYVARRLQPKKPKQPSSLEEKRITCKILNNMQLRLQVSHAYSRVNTHTESTYISAIQANVFIV